VSLSNYLENKLLDHVFRNTAYTPPAIVYVSLHTSDPGETGTNELPVADGYTRQTGAFDVAASGATANSTAITFTNSGSAWAAVSYFATWDAASAGNCLGIGPLAASKTVAGGDTGTFAVGALTITAD
jgi:hypothetical protein